MGLWNGTKQVAKRLVDVRVDRWMSWNYLNDNAGRFKLLLKDLITPKQPKRAETFEEAVIRLNLSEATLQQRILEFTRLCYFFVGLSVILLGYGLYVAISGKLLSSMIVFCLAAYCLSQAFHFHFWIFQIKNRKLGCSVKEWFHSKARSSTDLSSPPNDQ